MRHLRGIPYSTTFDLNNKKLLTLHKTAEAILSDLDKAEELLKNDDVVNVETTASVTILKDVLCSLISMLWLLPRQEFTMLWVT